MEDVSDLLEEYNQKNSQKEQDQVWKKNRKHVFIFN